MCQVLADASAAHVLKPSRLVCPTAVHRSWHCHSVGVLLVTHHNTVTVFVDQFRVSLQLSFTEERLVIMWGRQSRGMGSVTMRPVLRPNQPYVSSGTPRPRPSTSTQGATNPSQGQQTTCDTQGSDKQGHVQGMKRLWSTCVADKPCMQ
jgi:hypothetical protein